MAHEKKTERPKPTITYDTKPNPPPIEVTDKVKPYYRVARAFSHVSLEREVKELTVEGYEPLGGVAVEPPDGQGHAACFLQAMVLK